MPLDRMLVYAQDLGGGKFMGPVIRALLRGKRTPELTVLAHPLSQRFFCSLGIKHLPVSGAGHTPVSVARWERFVRNGRFDRIFCTTSSPYQDRTNCHLIVAAQKLGIPTMGILDHWKGFDRFYYQGKAKFLPDHICCIDEQCRRKFKTLGILADRVHVVGHPYLETVCNGTWRRRGTGEKIRLLLVSQPNTSDKSFLGVFFLRHNKRRLVDEIARLAMDSSFGDRRRLQIHIRPHPKESGVQPLPFGVKVDESERWDQCLTDYDIFLGLDSMALIEAHLAGKYCISLSLPALRDLSDVSPHYLFCKRLSALSELPSALDDAERFMAEKDGSRPSACAVFEGSTKKTLTLLRRFIDSGLN